MANIVFPAIEERARKAQEMMIKRFKKQTVMEPFPDGVFVMAKNHTKKHKFESVYEGPFKVLRRNRGGSYELMDMDGTRLGRNYPPSDLKLISHDPASIDTDNTWEVAFIADDRTNENGTREYKVRWKGFQEKDDTWEPYEHFHDVAVIDAYWKAKERR